MNVIYLPTSRITPRENRFKDLDEKTFNKLADSIKENGILEPVHVVRENGNYALVQGHQRYMAAKQLNLAEIPCIIDNDEQTALAAEFDTNIYRRHLTDKEMEEYERLKDRIASETICGLIPELQFMKETLSPAMLRFVQSWPENIQRTFYKSIPVKFVENVKEKEQYENRIKSAEKAIKEQTQEIRTLKEKLETMKQLEKDFQTIKNSKKEDFKKALEIERKRIETELKEKYSGETLVQKIEEEKEKLEEHYTRKYEDDIEEYRKIAEKHSKERAELEKKIIPFQEEVEKLRKDLKMYKEAEENAKTYEQWAKEKLEKLLKMQRIPQTIEAIAKEIAHVRNRMISCKEYLIELGDAVHEEREDNLKAIKAFEAEFKNLQLIAQDIIAMVK